MVSACAHVVAREHRQPISHCRCANDYPFSFSTRVGEGGGGGVIVLDRDRCASCNCVSDKQTVYCQNFRVKTVRHYTDLISNL